MNRGREAGAGLRSQGRSRRKAHSTAQEWVERKGRGVGRTGTRETRILVAQEEERRRWRSRHSGAGVMIRIPVQRYGVSTRELNISSSVFKAVTILDLDYINETPQDLGFNQSSWKSTWF